MDFGVGQALLLKNTQFCYWLLFIV